MPAEAREDGVLDGLHLVWREDAVVVDAFAVCASDLEEPQAVKGDGVEVICFDPGVGGSRKGEVEADPR